MMQLGSTDSVALPSSDEHLTSTLEVHLQGGVRLTEVILISIRGALRNIGLSSDVRASFVITRPTSPVEQTPIELPLWPITLESRPGFSEFEPYSIKLRLDHISVQQRAIFLQALNSMGFFQNIALEA